MSKVCLSFQVAYDAMQMERSQNALPFLPQLGAG